MIGGRGDLNNNITVGSGNGQIDVISPGDGISSSLTSSSSMQQVELGDRTNAIGTFTVGALTLASGGVYDWEISDFSGTAGTDWDLLLYDSLSYNTSDTFNINIFGLEANGSAGPMAGVMFGRITPPTASSSWMWQVAVLLGAGLQITSPIWM